MTEAVEMFRPNQDKWEPFIACWKVDMAVLLSYLEKLPVDFWGLVDFRLLKGNSSGLSQHAAISKFPSTDSDSAISALSATSF